MIIAEKKWLITGAVFFFTVVLILPAWLPSETQFLLCKVDISSVGTLQNGPPSSALHAIFQKNGISLSKKAGISLTTEKHSSQWQLIDGNEQFILTIRSEKIIIHRKIWQHGPTLRNLLIFGVHQQRNILFEVAQSARLTLYLSFISLLVSALLGIVLIFCDYYRHTRFLFHPLLRLTTYCPRLFLLILFSAIFSLSRPSQLPHEVSFYLIWILGISGGVFLASQSSAEISDLRDRLFVHFADSLGFFHIKIFIRHILRNCVSLPLTITKQFRDNILFLSTLSFIGLIHLQQPTDFGGLIQKYAGDPEVFQKAWWALFFPCFTLITIILTFDSAGELLAKNIEKSPLVSKI